MVLFNKLCLSLHISSTNNVIYDEAELSKQDSSGIGR